MPGQRRSVLILLACCVCWGLSFPLMELVGRTMGHRAGSGEDLAARAVYNALRFGLAALLMLLLLRGRLFAGGRRELHGALLVGGSFGTGMWLQMAGLATTAPPVSAFLTALTVLLVPLVQVFGQRRPLARATLFGIACALPGTVILALGTPGGPTAGPWPGYGEVMTLGGTICFTAAIFAIDHAGRHGDPWRIGCGAFVVTALISLLIGLALGAGRLPGWGLAGLGGRDVLLATVVLVLVCSVLAFVLMLRHQPRVTPAVAAVAYTSEPVFATAWAPFFLPDQIHLATILGGILILIGSLSVTRPPPSDDN